MPGHGSEKPALIPQRLLNRERQQAVTKSRFVAIALPGQNIVLQTSRGNMAAIIVVNDSGIYVSNGQGASVTLVGPSVTIDGLVTQV